MPPQPHTPAASQAQLAGLADLVVPLAFRISVALAAVMARIVVSGVLADGRVLWALLRDVVHLLLSISCWSRDYFPERDSK